MSKIDLSRPSRSDKQESSAKAALSKDGGNKNATKQSV